MALALENNMPKSLISQKGRSMKGYNPYLSQFSFSFYVQ